MYLTLPDWTGLHWDLIGWGDPGDPCGPGGPGDQGGPGGQDDQPR